MVVNETDDGDAVFERVAKGLGGGAGAVAVGDRVWAETTLQLGRLRRRPAPHGLRRS